MTQEEKLIQNYFGSDLDVYEARRVRRFKQSSKKHGLNTKEVELLFLYFIALSMPLSEALESVKL